jgi:predicted RNase H-like HicB family nuclease
MRFKVLFCKSPNGERYWAMVPAMPGCFSSGNNFEAVQENVKEAIELHIRGMLQDGEELPGEGVFIVAHADVDVRS